MIPRRGTKLLNHCGIGGQCELRATSVFKKGEGTGGGVGRKCDSVFSGLAVMTLTQNAWDRVRFAVESSNF